LRRAEGARARASAEAAAVIRDGLDLRPFRSCLKWCGGSACLAFCSLSNIDAELRADGWIPIEDAPLEPGIDVEVEGLTSDGRRILARYWARGDYVDRWTDRGANLLLDLTHWRPIARRLPSP
jgi:hypothetical protein